MDLSFLENLATHMALSSHSNSWVVGLAIVAGWLYVYWIMQKGMKGPKSWPILGSTLEIGRNITCLHDWMYDYFKDGTTTYKYSLFGKAAAINSTVDPSNIEYMLKINHQNFAKAGDLRERMHDFLGDGIFNSAGDIWRRHRKLASLEFSSRKLRDYSTCAFRIGALNMISILDKAMSSSDHVEFQDLAMRMTLDSICKVGFGVDLGCCCLAMPDIPFAKNFNRASELTFSRNQKGWWKIARALNIGQERELKKVMKDLDAFTFQVIQKRRADIQSAHNLGKPHEQEDLLSRFMSFKAGEEDNYTDQDLRDAILNFIIAGHETTGVALTWFIYCTCLNPNVVDKICDEIATTLGNQVVSYKDFAESLTFESLNKMHYLHAAISETLRLYPPVPKSGQYALEDDVLPDGHKVKKGDILQYVTYSMGRMTSLWGPDAKEFKPDRWLKDGFVQKQSPFKFTSFQGGVKACLGKDSAMLQLKLTAALLLHFFTFQLVPGHVVTYRTTFTLPMKYGLCVTVSQRC